MAGPDVDEPPEPHAARDGSGDAALERFSAGALDWPAVRTLLEPLASSALGRRSLAELVPRTDEEAAEAILRAREMQALLEAGSEPPLGALPDPVPLLQRAERYRRALDPEDLAAVAGLLRRVEGLGHWLAGEEARMPRCAGLWASLPDLAPLRAQIDAAVEPRGRVRDDASPALHAARREIETLARTVERTIREVAARPALRAVLADGHAGQIHRRGGRAVLAVRARQSGRLPGIVHDRSQSGETVFVEPREVVEPANAIAALEADCEREVDRILNELTRAVLRRADAVRLVGARLGEIELALVSARFAAQVGGRPARLPGETGAGRGLVLRGLRHPLLLAEERRARIERVVPVDLRLGDGFDLLLITGPNTGGKTLALKTAGLAVLMTRMGLALPCGEGTTVPLYDGIVADIGDEQEIQQNLSTFSSHLLRVHRGLERAGPRTLVLLDELGGGTDPTEGAALGHAILERLLSIGCPTLASTHLGRLKEFGFRNERAENAHVEFDLETLAPLYSVVIGAPGESRALAIARRLGFPPEIVEAAEGLLERLPGDAERLMQDVRGVRVEAERQRSAAEAQRIELEGEARALQAERDAVAGRSEQLEAEAQRGLEERVARARLWLERAHKLLPQLPSGGPRERVQEVVAGLEEALGDALLTERRRDFVAGLKKGELVWLPRFKKRCRVVRVHKDRREVEVLLGKRRLVVGFDDVTFYESL